MNLVEFINSMPDTDRDLAAKQALAKPEEKPAPENADKPKPKPPQLGEASKFSGPEPETAILGFNEILGSKDTIRQLLQLVRDPGDNDYKDYKAAYVLHGVVLQAGRPGNENKRKLLAQTLASELSGRHSTAVKGYFIRELQLLGSKEALDALGDQLTNPDLYTYASQALIAIQDGAAPRFRKALSRSSGPNRIALVQAIGTLRDEDSSKSLRGDLKAEDPEVRRIAAWALANIGDVESGRELLRLADAATGWERDQYTKYALLLAERLGTSGKRKEAAEIYNHLLKTRNDAKDKFLRETIERSLYPAA